jgi:hypothetical protein
MPYSQLLTDCPLEAIHDDIVRGSSLSFPRKANAHVHLPPNFSAGRP